MTTTTTPTRPRASAPVAPVPTLPAGITDSEILEILEEWVEAHADTWRVTDDPNALDTDYRANLVVLLRHALCRSHSTGRAVTLDRVTGMPRWSREREHAPSVHRHHDYLLSTNPYQAARELRDNLRETERYIQTWQTRWNTIYSVSYALWPELDSSAPALREARQQRLAQVLNVSVEDLSTLYPPAAWVTTLNREAARLLPDVESEARAVNHRLNTLRSAAAGAPQL